MYIDVVSCDTDFQICFQECFRCTPLLRRLPAEPKVLAASLADARNAAPLQGMRRPLSGESPSLSEMYQLLIACLEQLLIFFCETLFDCLFVSFSLGECFKKRLYG